MMRDLVHRIRSEGHAALALAAVGALALLGALIHKQFGVFGNCSWPLPRAAAIKSDQIAFKAHLPAWCRGATAERRAILLLDQKPVGMKVRHADTVVSRGNGAYKIQQSYLYFSLPRNADPRPIISRLSLSIPRPVNPKLWIAGAACLLIGGFGVWRSAPARQRLSAMADKLAAIPQAAVVAGIFAAALAIALARLPDAMTFSDGSFSVKGMPYTDAAGWDELAINLSEGRGFEGAFSCQRPLYPAMLSTLYTFTGPSLLAARALNAFWLALAATAACALGMLGGSRAAGIAAAIAVVIGEDNVTFSHLLLTESSGTAFAVTSALALSLALASPKWWRIVLAAALLGLANLTSGFGLLVLVGYGLVALVTWWRMQGPKRAVAQSLVLAGVVALAWMPWLFRQHAAHGIWNLSASNANLMYAAAASDNGRLDTTVGNAWRAAGVASDMGSRYKFYMRKYVEAIKETPSVYAKNFLRGITAFGRHWTFTGPDHFGIVLVALIAIALAELRRLPIALVFPASALVIGGCFALGESKATATVVWPVATVLALATCSRTQRPLWALVAVTVPFVALLAGLIGGAILQRLWTACDWTMPLLVVKGGSGAMQTVAGWLGKRMRRPALPIQAEETGPATTSSVHAAIVVTAVPAVQAFLGVILAGGLYLAHAGDTTPVATVTPSLRDKAFAAARARYDFLATVTRADPRVQVAVCEFGEHSCIIDAWEDQQHWARSFEVRPYPRTVAAARLLDGPGGGTIPCQLRTLPQDLPRSVPLLVIGVSNEVPDAPLDHDLTMLEVLGYAPLMHGGGDADWDAATWLPFTPEAANILQRAP